MACAHSLEHENIDYEYKAVHLLNDGGEQLKDDFAAKNPSKELPCLEIDGMNLAQSMAIISYLEETVDGGEALFPKDPKLRYKMRRLCDIIGTGIQPIQNLRVLKYCMAKVDGKDAKTKVKLDWGRYWIDLGFTLKPCRIRWQILWGIGHMCRPFSCSASIQCKSLRCGYDNSDDSPY